MLRVRARALPVIFCHQIDNLHRRLTRQAKSFERRSHVSLVVAKLDGKLVLVVAPDHRIVFDEKCSQSPCGCSFTVAEVMNDLASAPLAWNGMCPQALGGEAVERFHYFVVTGGILWRKASSAG